jgi:hypothetical protein
MASPLQNTRKVGRHPRTVGKCPTKHFPIITSFQANGFNPLQQRLQQVTAGVANFCAI